MFFRLKNSAALVALAFIGWVAFMLGSSFYSVLVIFSLIMWAIGGMMAVYMVFFRGMKFTLFKDVPVDVVVPVGEGVLTPEGDVVLDDGSHLAADDVALVERRS